MKGLRNLVVAGSTILLLCQCASKGEVRQMDRQIRAVNQKVEDVKSKTSNQMQKGQASSGNKLDSLTAETRQLRALLEESNQRNRSMIEQTTANLASLQATLEQFRTEDEERIKALESSIDQLAGGLTRVKQARVQAAERRARDAARKAEEARKRTVIAANAAKKNTSVQSAQPVTLRPTGRKVRRGSGAVQPATTSLPKKSAPKAATKTEVAEKTVTAAPPVAPPPAQAAGGNLYNQGIASFKAAKYSEAYKILNRCSPAIHRGARPPRLCSIWGNVCIFRENMIWLFLIIKRLFPIIPVIRLPRLPCSSRVCPLKN